MSPASWSTEEMRRTRTMIAIINPPELKVSFAWADAWRNMQWPPGSAPMRAVGMPYGPARNHCLKTALDNNFAWLFFVDSDVVMPPDALMRLLATGKDLVGGVYRQRFPPYKIASFMKRMAPIPNQPGKMSMEKADLPAFQPGSVVPVDFLPTGCTLYSRRCMETVLARYPKPFEWTLDIDAPGSGLSEDFMFCERAKSLGIQPWLHTGIDCQHELAMAIGQGGLVGANGL